VIDLLDYFLHPQHLLQSRCGVPIWHSPRQDSLPADYDAVVDRKNDLIYNDRTLFDERMAILITDYVNIVNSLIKLAEDNKVKKALVDGILEQQADTRNFSTGKHL